ncbi:MAG: NAD(P)/FAD-dependent oxidoreductase [Flavisolibacter sp.]|nr:NAD(P)/FAD-dependent oxidoreductase [Flavisolibacter sp.]
MAIKVVIVGAGFAGLRLARKLNNRPGFEILLIDKLNYHQFQPLFYQVATAALDASNISFPLRKAFHNSKNVRIRLEKVKQVVSEQNKIITESEEIGYDILVLAMGADTNFFGNQNLATKAFPMKSTVEALQIRHRLVQNFEDALLVKDPLEYQKLMNIVIAGGGPTGVEVAGALADMKRYVLPKDYPEHDFSKMNIYLLEGGPRTLGPMSEKSSDDSCRYLDKMGVIVMTSSLVKDYDGEQVVLGDGKTIPTKMVIWAAGIKGNVPEGIDKSLIVRGNRIKVDRYCRVEGMNNVYALGDLAYMETPKYPKGHPQVASVAIAQADVLAKNLRLMESKSNRIYEFEYHDKGSMATIGRNLAVVDIPKPKLHVNGFFAWFIWMSLHLFLILGVKNKLMIFINWIYNYFTYDQNLRLIFKEFYRPKKSASAQAASSSQPEVRPSQDWSPTKPVEQKREDDDLRQAARFNR